ncbi:MDC1 protein, partial [Copsychus sechellarum]|nr:MDC1 protein [Copsychus sechellarum]
AEAPNPDVPDTKIGSQVLLVDSDTDVEEEGPNPDVELLKRLQSPPGVPEGPDVRLRGPNPDVGMPKTGYVGPPQTPLKSPGIPDVVAEGPRSPETALGEPLDPDVGLRGPNPDVGGPPGPTQEGAEAPPTPQVRRSQRLAESRGGGASAGPKPRPQSSHNQSGAGLGEAMPSMSIKGNGRGLDLATPLQEEEPAVGSKSRLRPQRAPGPAHIRVLFTGLVASPALLVALSSLGGTEATSVRDCSHLVTDGIRRTLKFLCALGRGVPIVTPEWLLQ